MKANVDKDECIACGLCPSICPECFEMESDGKAGIKGEDVPKHCKDEVEEAVESCPVNAISIE